MIHILLSAGLDVNVRGALGDTPLHTATYNGYKDAPSIVQALLKAGADTNVATTSKEMTPLHVVAYSASSVKAQLLIDAGVKLEPYDNYNRTPRWLASRWKRSEVVYLLQQSQVGPEGRYPLRTSFGRSGDHGHRFSSCGV